MTLKKNAVYVYHLTTSSVLFGYKAKSGIKYSTFYHNPRKIGNIIVQVHFTFVLNFLKILFHTGVPQTFKDFTASSRFWRFHLLENYGGNITCFQGLALYGVDDRIPSFFSNLDMPDYTVKFVEKVS